MSAVPLEPELDPRLIEAAVLLATRSQARTQAFHAERDTVYDILDPERREAAFETLHRRWFTRLALDGPFRETLDEQPSVARGCRRWLVAVAHGRRDQVADLLVAADVSPTLLVRVLAETVATPERLRRWLRRELLHASDMLDPAFGYEPTLPREAAGGPRERVVRGSYRLVWDVYVDGRLVRRGMLPATVRGERLAEFRRAFPHLGPRGEAAFDAFFEAPGLTHGALLAFATAGPEGAPLPRCRLCDLPTRDFEPAPAALPDRVRASIERDFPAWRPADGLCGRCVEVYVCRDAPLSRQP